LFELVKLLAITNAAILESNSRKRGPLLTIMRVEVMTISKTMMIMRTMAMDTTRKVIVP
jgi:hypothetical protein